ncbi:MAG: hypothetical protein ABI743_09465 [bacterium]
MTPPPPFPDLIARLEDHYGPPPLPPARDPFALILWEAVAYLVPDERRNQAFTMLRDTVGLDAASILKASDAQLLAAARLGGMHPERRVERLRECAEIVIEECEGDLIAVLMGPLVKAKKQLQRFSGIGEPGAEKILLFTHTAPILALESNGVRVLTRMGYAPELKNYSATYRALREALAPTLPTDCAWLIAAHQLLRQHGQEVCKTTNPRCGECVVRKGCAYGKSFRPQ